MRHIGSLANREDAQRLVHYLVAKGISALALPENGEQAIWIREENQVPQAAEELRKFFANPQDPQFVGVEQQALQVLREEQRKQRIAQQNYVEMRRRWGRGGLGRVPLTVTLIALAIGVSLLTDFAKNSDRDSTEYTVYQQLAFCSQASFEASNDPLADIKQGQLWRLFTPLFMHGGMGHLVFNLLWLYQLGSLLERRNGAPWLAALTFVTGVAGALGQALVPPSLGGAFNAIGLSGVVYGYFGYLWIKSFDPTFGLRLSGQTVVLMLGWLALGFTGTLNHWLGVSIANWAHLCGLAAGMLMAWIGQNIGRR